MANIIRIQTNRSHNAPIGKSAMEVNWVEFAKKRLHYKWNCIIEPIKEIEEVEKTIFGPRKIKRKYFDLVFDDLEEFEKASAILGTNFEKNIMKAYGYEYKLFN